MKALLQDIKKSFYDDNGEFSSRKLTAFAIILCDISAHIEWLEHCFATSDFSLLTTVLTIDYAFIAALFGMTTYSKIQDKKTKPNENVDTKK